MHTQSIPSLCLDQVRLEVSPLGGSFDLFYNDIFLTKGLGGYTSFLIDGTWYSSRDASCIFPFSKKSRMLTMQMRHEEIGVTQIWNLVGHGSGKVVWDVELHTEKKLPITWLNTNCMLIPAFWQWRSAASVGGFTNVFSSDWVTFWDRYVSQEDLTVYAHRLEYPPLPSVQFSLEYSDFAQKALVQNSSQDLGARVLAYSVSLTREQGRVLRPGNYTLFRGYISVREN